MLDCMIQNIFYCWKKKLLFCPAMWEEFVENMSTILVIVSAFVQYIEINIKLCIKIFFGVIIGEAQ